MTYDSSEARTQIRTYMDTSETAPGQINLSDVRPYFDYEEDDIRNGAVIVFNNIADDEADRILPYIDSLAALLTDQDNTVRANALYSLNIIAEHQPDKVVAYVDEIVNCVSIDNCTNNALHVLSVLANHEPSTIRPYLSTVATCLGHNEELVRQKAAKIFSECVQSDPAAVKQHTNELASATQVSQSDKISVNLAAYTLSNLAEEYPVAVESCIDQTVHLFGSPNDKTRANITAL